MTRIKEAEATMNRINDAIARNTAIAKKKAAELLKRMIPQILLQSFAIVGTATASYILMTWIVQDLAKVQSTYLGALYEVLGTLVLMILVLVSINTRVYRRRLQEINTLSHAISRVAGGDFEYKIHVKPNEPMATIYEDFNKMSAELSGVQILRNDFINSYSHEFKTPIASIGGFASLLLEKELSPEEQRQYLEIIRDESDRLTSLAKNTILLSKLTSQHIVSDVEQYNLGEQLRQCAIIESPHWLEKEQELSSDLPDVMFTGSRELLQHLWLNLIGNAVKYTQKGGCISVVLRTEGTSAVVAITDNGEGMSEETQAHLFDPYFQGDSSRSVQGLGLGLSIARRIVELSSGTISVQSSLGEGSTFTVTLPLRLGSDQVN